MRLQMDPEVFHARNLDSHRACGFVGDGFGVESWTVIDCEDGLKTRERSKEERQKEREEKRKAKAFYV